MPASDNNATTIGPAGVGIIVVINTCFSLCFTIDNVITDGLAIQHLSLTLLIRFNLGHMHIIAKLSWLRDVV